MDFSAVYDIHGVGYAGLDRQILGLSPFDSSGQGQ
jgi:hypothetical protein